MVVGIVGRKRHGKDTVADYLAQKYGFEKYSFANPLKRGAMEMFGFTEEQVFGDLKDVIDPVWGCTPRQVLQVLGTELLQYDIQNHIPAFKEIGRLIWVKNFARFYENNPGKNLSIADVRFNHEVAAIKQLGGVIIKVVRPGMPDGDFHASEIEIDEMPYDHLIINDGSLEDLYNKVESIGLFNESIKPS
jgi:hypothetical protein